MPRLSGPTGPWLRSGIDAYVSCEVLTAVDADSASSVQLKYGSFLGIIATQLCNGPCGPSRGDTENRSGVDKEENV